jgi:hypothetical protein
VEVKEATETKVFSWLQVSPRDMWDCFESNFLPPTPGLIELGVSNSFAIGLMVSVHRPPKIIDRRGFLTPPNQVAGPECPAYRWTSACPARTVQADEVGPYIRSLG